jgi:hypothetical protein
MLRFQYISTQRTRVLIFLAERLERKIGASYLWAAGAGGLPYSVKSFTRRKS